MQRQPKSRRAAATVQSVVTSARPGVKEISPLELLLRSLARLAAGAGVVALLGWLTWIMLDVKHMQSGFTLPM
jgi:hypothetical protein